MELNGVPLHPLVVHAVVVLGPLAAFAGLAYAIVSKWRWLLLQRGFTADFAVPAAAPPTS